MLKSRAGTQPRHRLKPGAGAFSCLYPVQHCAGMYTAMADWPLTGVDEMGKQIDWSQAPEWADKHGLIGLSQQPVWFNSSRYVYVDGHQGGRDFLFAGNGFQRGSVSSVTSRPTTPSWSDEGLPSVGVVCEYNPMPVGKPKKWHKVEVVYASEWVIVMRCIGAPNGHEGGNGVEIAMAVDDCSLEDIRPIRTPEQIAADERERFAEGLARAMGKEGRPNSLDQARRMYDLGYRKP